MLYQLVQEKVCLVGSNLFNDGQTFSEEVCSTLDSGNHTEEQEYVQTTIGRINLVTMFAQGIPPIFVTMILGAWTDRHGRKPALLMPFFGLIVTVNSSLACVHSEQLNIANDT